jgi:hypothetical protein
MAPGSSPPHSEVGPRRSTASCAPRRQRHVNQRPRRRFDSYRAVAMQLLRRRYAPLVPSATSVPDGDIHSSGMPWCVFRILLGERTGRFERRDRLGPATRVGAPTRWRVRTNTRTGWNPLIAVAHSRRASVAVCRIPSRAGRRCSLGDVECCLREALRVVRRHVARRQNHGLERRETASTHPSPGSWSGCDRAARDNGIGDPREHAAGVVRGTDALGPLVELIELGGGHCAAAATAAPRERRSGHPPAQGTG